MKYAIGGIVVVASILSCGQALAMETSVDRVGMAYVHIPLTKKFMRSNETAVGFRLGQTRFSTNQYGNLLHSFANNPAVVEFEFRPAGRFGDIHFRLQEFKINGISSLEKQYITGGMGFVAVPAAAAVLTGVASVAAVGALAASSSSSSDSSSDSNKASDTKTANSTAGSKDTSTDSTDSSNDSHDVADDDNDPNHQDTEDDHDDDNDVADNSGQDDNHDSTDDSSDSDGSSNG